MRIEIYRFGHYVNAVDSKESLYQWLLDNVPYDKSDGFIPPTTTLDVCMMLAEKKNFTFKVNNDMERIDKILAKAKLEKVAKSFVKLKKKGENYIFDCPFCGGTFTGYISIEHQIYKCFACGKTGNVVNFVMEIKNIPYEEALKYLEKTYKIK